MPDRENPESVGPEPRDVTVSQLREEGEQLLSLGLRRIRRNQNVIWLAILALAVFLAVGALVEFTHNSRRISDAERIARSVDAHVRENSREIQRHRTESLLRQEEVCSATHRGPPCQALFHRLEEDITRYQRKLLVCGILRELAQTPVVRDLRRQTNCNRFTRRTVLAK